MESVLLEASCTLSDCETAPSETSLTASDTCPEACVACSDESANVAPDSERSVATDLVFVMISFRRSARSLAAFVISPTSSLPALSVFISTSSFPSESVLMPDVAVFNPFSIPCITTTERMMSNRVKGPKITFISMVVVMIEDESFSFSCSAQTSTTSPILSRSSLAASKYSIRAVSFDSPSPLTISEFVRPN